ncbi:metalloprotease [Burkholderia sp. KK1]|uniref:Putative neutral zinc metallopeptidase n=1 Tax=Caballeronia cordobensis TaxID=1353886 RepID=A0A158HE04_CABCO|nr:MULTISPECIES: neutral zinc metallopeptidase [Caballeronia]AQH00964.1 metalloprotease [Burkholderia sp. KK1]BBP98678.1 membrane protein [Burkholderia sp. SFA1]MCE4544257.1 neutral zinc metallopeptidase [Caballeronia sp. PC1]MCE4571408.1 neutral zinc metallopeptidase [Caballeronia sp. CLC5]SAL42243.1 putative neutral zinc metallopeptidase [Caballeronia cordobensis]
MRLDDEAESRNVEDRRGGGGGFRVGGGSIGIGTIVIALAASYFFGINPMTIINGAQVLQGNAPQQQAAPSNAPPANDPGAVFVRRVLGNTERTWQQVFRTQFNQDYPAPKLVMFSGATQTACGTGQAAMGPFYCPGDRKVYIDLSFYRELRDRFGASGDFAQAYVIAHEVGHHVQNVLGIMGKVDQARSRMSKEQANALSVRVELQADCFAGVWAAVAQQQNAKLIEPGDFEQGLNAAAAIGDDRLQQQSQGRIVPEAFTHGTSAQRQRWLRRGMSTGDVSQCDTFSARSL